MIQGYLKDYHAVEGAKLLMQVVFGQELSEYEHEKDKTNMKIKLTNTIENLSARQCLSILFYHSDRESDIYEQYKLIEDDDKWNCFFAFEDRIKGLFFEKYAQKVVFKQVNIGGNLVVGNFS